MLTVGDIVDRAVGIVLSRVVLDGGAVVLVLRKGAVALGGEELDDTLAAVGTLVLVSLTASGLLFSAYIGTIALAFTNSGSSKAEPRSC